MYMPINLSDFKRNINLVNFLLREGFEIDKRRSTKTSHSLSRNEEKLVVSRKGGTWVYFSVHDESDRGTIVDFLLKRNAKSIPEAVRILSGSTQHFVSPKRKPTPKGTPDRQRVQTIFEKCRPITRHRYLENRGLLPSQFTSQRFRARLFSDRYNNVVFPHFSNGQVCGLELKNDKRGLLVRGSTKTFWRSNMLAGDDTVVVTESVIDALSYQRIKPSTRSVYFATGGGLSSRQCGLMVEFLKQSHKINRVFLATDADSAGDRIADRLASKIAEEGLFPTILRDRPDGGHKDWNELLTASER